MNALRRPHVAVFGRDVEVAEHHHLVGGCAGGRQPVAQRLEPDELAVVELGAHLPAVGDVDAHDAHAVARCREHTRVALVGVDVILVEAVGRVADAHAREDGDAVPLPLPVVHRLVAQGLEAQVRERLVGELGLLQAQDVGLGVGEPLLDPLLACLQRVDVPGGDAHPATLPTRAVLLVLVDAVVLAQLRAAPRGRSGRRAPPPPARRSTPAGSRCARRPSSTARSPSTTPGPTSATPSPSIVTDSTPSRRRNSESPGIALLDEVLALP